MGWIGSNLRKAYARAAAATLLAERESQAREDLLAIVSHDLKNPLSAIRLSAELLARNAHLGNVSQDVFGRCVKTVDQSSARTLRLIEDLLDRESIRSGTLHITLQPESSQLILKEAFDLMFPIAQAKLVHLERNVPSGDIFLECDRQRITQALGKLLGNAIKFTPALGQVEIGFKAVDQGALFWVTDNGPGIPLEQQTQLFDRYWRAKITARLGTGLGLAITKGIIEAHRSHIRVESRPGLGATFAFTLTVIVKYPFDSSHGAKS